MAKRLRALSKEQESPGVRYFDVRTAIGQQLTLPGGT